MNVYLKKLHPNAVIPFYAKDGDAGMDLTATSKESNGIHVTYGTGIAMQIPKGFVGLLFPRSSVYKKQQTLANSVGVIDSGYRGEIKLKFTTSSHEYKVGERIGQIIIIPHPRINFVQSKTLDESDRGDGGFGSTS